MNRKQSRGSKYVLFERKLMRKILSLVLVAICAVILLRELTNVSHLTLEKTSQKPKVFCTLPSSA